MATPTDAMRRRQRRRTAGADAWPTPSKSNILVVDDLPEKLLVFQTILEELGQNLVTARSGEEALRWLLDHEFAVILLDVNMPGMDGFETAALIRQRQQVARTRRSSSSPRSPTRCTPPQGYSLGAVDYILTPVVPEILRSQGEGASSSCTA